MKAAEKLWGTTSRRLAAGDGWWPVWSKQPHCHDLEGQFDLREFRPIRTLDLPLMVCH